ncbi:hypothetical protein LX32DRAFT_401327 [Colletotrichum zoysiae]|uniref:Uncharacterized protein n=1 Tax=Colletotrichum zoysiae TaxID=1216348 RepID=A0AAD9M4B4_9PEZI|nr:hypothetical protein LX32DRAFT_401327 [Colletotrichum zoysiae]
MDGWVGKLIVSFLLFMCIHVCARHVLALFLSKHSSWTGLLPEARGPLHVVGNAYPVATYHTLPLHLGICLFRVASTTLGWTMTGFFIPVPRDTAKSFGYMPPNRT